MSKIIHIDMDAFFTSVEQRDRPELRGKPVIVGGDPEKRGVVAGASYEARRFGVRSAMSAAQARKLCPQGIFLKPRFSRYAEVSEKIMEIFRSVTPLVEPISLDEAYLDVTENALGEPLARKVAEHLKNRIRNELNLTASAGVAPNKFVAKLASDLKKPDGLVVIPPEKVLAFIEPLAVEKLWGVGPATQKALNEMGIWTVGDIRRTKSEELERTIGSFGRFLHGLANGEDPRRVEPERESKSCGAETTFEKDISRIDLLLEHVHELSKEVAESLVSIERRGRTVTLKLRYSDFQTITRSQSLGRYTDEVDKIARTASRLLLESTEAGRRPARLIGVSVSGFLGEGEPEQLWFDFPTPFVD